MGFPEPKARNILSARIYANRPLKDYEIRVLNLLPGRTSDPIECTLHVVNVNKYTDYTAVSYVWGTEAWNRAIRVDGINMPVSPNLEAALLKFRLSSDSIQEEADAFYSMFEVEGTNCSASRGETKPNRGVIRLWIDAICINQADLSERVSQVMLMDRVYSNAKRLIVWLGSEIDDSDKAMDLIDTLDSRRSQYNQEKEQERIENYRSSSPFPEACIALGALVNRPWFSRCWILQEYVLGFRGTNGIFQCGSKRIQCAKLENIYRFFSDEDLSPSIDTIFRSAIDKVTVFNFLRINYKMNHSPTTHLANLLYQSRKAASTDPRDKIYSILGVLQKSFEENHDLSKFDTSSLIIDYSASVQDVYSSFVKSVIDQTRRLHILGDCCARGPHVERTWTPDWTMPATEGFLGLNYEIRKAKFQASKETDSHARFSHDLTTMTVTGFVFDQMINTWDVENMRRTAPEFQAEMDNLWEAMKINNPYGGEKDARLNLWRTLFTDPESDIPIMLELAEFMRRIEGEETSTTTSKNTISPHTKSWSHPALLTQLPNWMSFNDRVFSTDKGYVGKIRYSERIRTGDLVCILLGCPTPVVLRQSRDYYEYVGDVYVAGVMHGEAMDALDDGGGGFWLRDFVLR